MRRWQGTLPRRWCAARSTGCTSRTPSGQWRAHRWPSISTTTSPTSSGSHPDLLYLSCQPPCKHLQGSTQCTLHVCYILKEAGIPCREKPRRQIHLKYNNWELEGEAGAWLDLEHTNAPHEQGADWWCAPSMHGKRAGTGFPAPCGSVAGSQITQEGRCAHAPDQEQGGVETNTENWCTQAGGGARAGGCIRDELRVHGRRGRERQQPGEELSDACGEHHDARAVGRAGH